MPSISEKVRYLPAAGKDSLKAHSMNGQLSALQYTTHTIQVGLIQTFSDKWSIKWILKCLSIKKVMIILVSEYHPSNALTETKAAHAGSSAI